MLKHLARMAYRRRRTVVAIWITGIIAAIMVAPSLAGDWTQQDRLNGSDSQRAYDLMEEHMSDGAPGGGGETIVFDGIAGHEHQITRAIENVKAVAGVTRVSELEISRDGNVGLLTVRIDPKNNENPAPTIVDDLRAATTVDGVKTSYAGWLFQPGEGPSSEMLGLVAALVILIIAFGSVVAAGLPVLVAIFGVTIGGAIVGILANVVHMGEVTQQVTAMICIGVGIDYTLLIVSRYRTALHATGDPQAAVVDAIDHAGRAVLLAGAIVAISLMGLFTIGMSTFSGLAIGAATGVLVAVLATITFAPALLGFVGHNINRLHIGRRRQVESSQNSRWAGFVQRHAKVFTFVGVGALLVLTVPVASLQLGFPEDAAVAPEGSTNRVAHDTISRAFGPGYHGPIRVVVHNPPSSLDTVTARIASTPGIISIGEVTFSNDRSIALFEAVPATGPSDRKTHAVLKDLRNNVVPALEAGNMRIHFGGDTALDIDFAQRCAERMPIFVTTVFLLSFLLLMIVFRSVVIPLKAVVMNVLSLGAAGGVLVAIFQWGWGVSLFGTSAGPVEPWIPELLFAIVFGLSMDYEIFLLTSIREAYRKGDDVSSAIVHGLGTTARVITAAAAIMTVVFASFLGVNELSVKMIGFGLAAAIAIDATVVRLLLLPAVMTLLGEANWWLPKWLDRILPHWEPEAPTPDGLGHNEPISRSDHVPTLHR
jgi:RND superfamily putative drug exporter